MMHEFREKLETENGGRFYTRAERISNLSLANNMDQSFLQAFSYHLQTRIQKL